MPIRATDDEALAVELWGNNKVWDDERKQYVPTEGEEKPCPGNSTETSSPERPKPTEKTGNSRPSTVRTTEPRSKNAKTASGTARSTGGSGKAAS